MTLTESPKAGAVVLKMTHGTGENVLACFFFCVGVSRAFSSDSPLQSHFFLHCFFSAEGREHVVCTLRSGVCENQRIGLNFANGDEVRCFYFLKKIEKKKRMSSSSLFFFSNPSDYSTRYNV